MNWTEKLKEILSWIASHSQRLSRKGMELPNHLANATVYFFESGMSEPVSIPTGATIIVLDAQGRLRSDVVLEAGKIYRLEVRDEQDVILFTQDDIKAEAA